MRVRASLFRRHPHPCRRSLLPDHLRPLRLDGDSVALDEPSGQHRARCPRRFECVDVDASCGGAKPQRLSSPVSSVGAYIEQNLRTRHCLQSTLEKPVLTVRARIIWTFASSVRVHLAIGTPQELPKRRGITDRHRYVRTSQSAGGQAVGEELPRDHEAWDLEGERRGETRQEAVVVSAARAIGAARDVRHRKANVH